ncbi:MAG: peptidylprolyl isomerase [Alphaproteobacteria bacterium]|nr:peptidylprolyl isomerase [Alphaproteobacteria bacterium]
MTHVRPAHHVLPRAIAGALAALALLAALPAPAQQAATRIAAVVNDDIVTEHDIAARLRLTVIAAGLDPASEAAQRLRPQVIRSLIDERLQIQEANRATIKATDQEIAENVRRLERQNNMQPGGFYAWLDENRIERSTAVEQIRASAAWAKLIRRRYGRTISVSEEEIDEAVAQRLASANAVERHVAEIFLPFDRAGDEDEVRRLAERLIEQMRAGVRFTQIARQFSQSASASAGGDLGWVQPGQLDPALESAIEGLGPGQLSPPLKLPSGYYILLLVERRNPAGDAEGAGDQTVGLRQIVVPLRPGAPADEQAERRKMAEELSRTVKDCGDMLATREGSGSLSGDLGKVRLGDLPPRLRQLVATQPIGKATAPLTTEAGFVVLMVCEREAPQKAAQKVNRDEIAEAITTQRLDNVARRVIRDLRRSAFIEVRG